MKFTMFVRPAGQKAGGWREDYDFPYVRTMKGAIEAATIQIYEWNARGTMKRRRHNGMIEKAREVVAVEFDGERRELL